MKLLEGDLDLCPRFKNCEPKPENEQAENYCCMNYENCDIYRKYKVAKDLGGFVRK